MIDLMRQQVLDLLRRHRVFPKKSLGQNFLVSDHAVERLFAEAALSAKDQVIEIGAGLGQITRLIAEKVRWVIALEFDPQLMAVLKEELAPFGNITLIQADAARCSYREVLEHFPDREIPGHFPGQKGQKEEGKVKVIGNLPYYVAVPILVRLEEIKDRISLIIATLQKELADRMLAHPAQKAYGELSVRIRYLYDATEVESLPAGAFYPRPKVTSKIISLHPLQSPRVSVQDEDLFFRLVRAAFSQRRKTLLNALKAHPELGVPREAWPDLLKESHLSPQGRGETLCLEEFAGLSDFVFRYLASRTS
ncbi:MAG: 16S rRNA (adenine(1518)-N(6)/adenine(1519)-N(6))-dimethyltransferase RsmA [bacterium]